MKTLADLKRDAKNKNMSLELVERFGKTGDEIPERLRGIRHISKTQTNAIYLINDKGEESWLSFDSAKLVEYDTDSLIIYSPAERDLTDEEKSVRDEWIRKQDEYYAQNPYGDFFWAGQLVYKNSPCPWMSGNKFIKGKYYQPHNNTVLDRSIKGEPILKYKVYIN